MCYNLEVSLSTGIFSYLSGYLILQRELTNYEYHCVLFFLLFSTVQFADSLLWISEMKKNMLNYITTSFIIPALLSSQVFFNIYVFNKIRNPLILFFMVLYILGLFYTFNGYSKPLCSNNISSPRWGNKEISLWQAFLFAALICYPDLKLFSLSIVAILFIKYIIKGSIGSLWCFIAAFTGIFYYFTFGK